MQLINNALPPMPLEQRMALLRGAEHYLNRFGITSVVELTGDLPELEAFAALRDRGELTIRTRSGFGKVAVNHHLTPEFLADLDKARKLYHDDWVSANLVKFFADGVGNPPPMFYEPAEYRRLLIESTSAAIRSSHTLSGRARFTRCWMLMRNWKRPTALETAGFGWSMYSTSRRTTCPVLRSFQPSWGCNRPFVAAVLLGIAPTSSGASKKARRY